MVGKEELSRLTVKQLKDELRALGLPVSGNKDVLIQRLHRENSRIDTERSEGSESSEWKLVKKLMSGERLTHEELSQLQTSGNSRTRSKRLSALQTLNTLQSEGKNTIEGDLNQSTTLGYSRVKGLQPLVEWATMTGELFKPEAREYGFTRFPIGLLLTGVPGCGKTMIAKAIAEEWDLSFIRAYPDQLVGGTVGDNERLIRDLLDKASKQAPSIVFIDEAEKLFGQTRGTSDYRASDAARDSAESILLQFMEEDESGVFFIFTANDFDKLSPALIDRFEERFFIDLPNKVARKEIICSMLAERRRNPDNFDTICLAEKSEGFTGRDIRSAIDEAMKKAFCQGQREMTTEDIEESFDNSSPTSIATSRQMLKMRIQALEGKMRIANAIIPEKKSCTKKRSRDEFLGWH